MKTAKEHGEIEKKIKKEILFQVAKMRSKMKRAISLFLFKKMFFFF